MFMLAAMAVTAAATAYSAKEGGDAAQAASDAQVRAAQVAADAQIEAVDKSIDYQNT